MKNRSRLIRITVCKVRKSTMNCSKTEENKRSLHTKKNQRYRKV